MSAAARAGLSLVAGVVCVAAGCGSSPPSHDATNSGALAFAQCVRAHGVPNWPDPNGSGVFDKSKLTSQQLGATNAQVGAAQAACRRFLPDGGSAPTASQIQREKAQSLEFAQCVRAHGVPNFPDPGSSGRIPDPATVGINQGSPKFQAANRACGKNRPPYMPSNSAYDAWARTHGAGS